MGRGIKKLINARDISARNIGQEVVKRSDG